MMSMTGNTRSLMVALMLPCLLASCIKDEAPGKECDIESAWVEGDAYAMYFYDVADMRKEDMSATETNITFIVRKEPALPTQIPVRFKLSPGATVEPANGSMQDFTTQPVNYTVTSEDGQWKRVYKVAFRQSAFPFRLFSFEHVEVREASSGNGGTYHHFYEIDSKGRRVDLWDSGNLGVLVLNSDATAESLPTHSTSEGYRGKGVCLNTQSTGVFGRMFDKPIAAGNLFWGSFLADYVVTNTLKSTQFGYPIDKEPVQVTGYYKYKPGSHFTNKKMDVEPGRIDEASIYAVFYRNKDALARPYYLYGDDMESDERLKANPQVYKIARVASLPPTDTWTKFEMSFEGRDADDKLVAENGFNLALVFSSSKEGAQFEGAVGSTLYVDEVELMFEK